MAYMDLKAFEPSITDRKLVADIARHVTVHTLRHSFATHLLLSRTNIRDVQELMGHSDVKTTEIYTHVMERDLNLVRSPLDRL